MKVKGCEDAKADWEKGWAWAKYDLELMLNNNTNHSTITISSVGTEEEKGQKSRWIELKAESDRGVAGSQLRK